MLRVVLIVFIIFFGLIIIRFMMLPVQAQQNLISVLRAQKMYSHTVYAGAPVGSGQIHGVKIYRGFFALDLSLGPEETQALLKILRDTANYDATPAREASKVDEMIFIYFDKKDLQLGESFLSSEGEIQTTPFELLGKTGYMNSRGLEQLERAIY